MTWPPDRSVTLSTSANTATGAPHFALGMLSEFNVGGAGGGTIRPPSTGDAGLVDASTAVNGLLITGVLLLTLGGGTLAVSRRRA